MSKASNHSTGGSLDVESGGKSDHELQWASGDGVKPLPSATAAEYKKNQVSQEGPLQERSGELRVPETELGEGSKPRNCDLNVKPKMLDRTQPSPCSRDSPWNLLFSVNLWIWWWIYFLGIWKFTLQENGRNKFWLIKDTSFLGARYHLASGLMVAVNINWILVLCCEQLCILYAFIYPHVLDKVLLR